MPIMNVSKAAFQAPARFSWNVCWVHFVALKKESLVFSQIELRNVVSVIFGACFLVIPSVNNLEIL